MPKSLAFESAVRQAKARVIEKATFEHHCCWAVMVFALDANRALRAIGPELAGLGIYPENGNISLYSIDFSGTVRCLMPSPIQPVLPMRFQSLILALGSLLMLNACAINSQPASLQTLHSSQSEQRIVVENEAAFRLDTGYQRSIRAGSEWMEIGVLDQGAVFKPVNGVFSIEASNVYEAYLVLHDSRLVGFYLPVEHTFSPLSQQVLLTTKKKEM